ncbi:hypothetical protein IKF15_00300 [Candidatus Saccharibacteria bacterium]|jgi:hypothetical protein|nr:hypothetical protein [Candidatus Saccharibacteria bacterium]
MGRGKTEETLSREELKVIALLIEKAHSDCLKKYGGERKVADVLNYWWILLEKIRRMAK